MNSRIGIIRDKIKGTFLTTETVLHIYVGKHITPRLIKRAIRVYFSHQDVDTRSRFKRTAANCARVVYRVVVLQIARKKLRNVCTFFVALSVGHYIHISILKIHHNLILYNVQQNSRDSLGITTCAVGMKRTSRQNSYWATLLSSAIALTKTTSQYIETISKFL